MSDRIVSHIEGQLGRICLKAGPLNVLNTADLRALAAAVTACDAAAVILLEADGERAFCAGVEIADHRPEHAAAMLDAFSQMALAFRHAAPIIVCSVGGPALGGGFELLLLADLVICSTRAVFSLPEIQLAALPPIACALLPKVVGAQRAFDAIVNARRIDAQTAYAWGLVGQVVEPEELGQAAPALCNRLLGYSHDALRACKRAIRSDDLAESMRIYGEELLPTPDAAEGINAFLEKRTPIWAHTVTTGGRP